MQLEDSANCERSGGLGGPGWLGNAQQWVWQGNSQSPYRDSAERCGNGWETGKVRNPCWGPVQRMKQRSSLEIKSLVTGIDGLSAR